MTPGTQEAVTMLVLVLVVPLALGLIFLPGIIAQCRSHHQRLAIWVLNLLAGWSGLGWVIALVWSCTAVRRSGRRVDPYAMPHLPRRRP